MTPCSDGITTSYMKIKTEYIIPIVNENDFVSYTEIQSEDKLFGDNDTLSAVVSVLCRAKSLVIFSDIDGFYDSDPRLHPDAKLIDSISVIDEKVLSLAGGAGSRRGTGGMKTKLQAAKLAMSQGIDTIITNGKNPAALYKIVKGDNVGTIILYIDRPLSVGMQICFSSKGICRTISFPSLSAWRRYFRFPYALHQEPPATAHTLKCHAPLGNSKSLPPASSCVSSPTVRSLCFPLP